MPGNGGEEEEQESGRGKETMRYRSIWAIVIGLVASGCDGEGPEGIVIGDPVEHELAGLWTGTEAITTQGDASSRVQDDGFQFAVSLMLEKDRRFTLRTFDFPVDGGEGRLCKGVYRATGRDLEFFPDSFCRALPLHRYTVGRSFPDGLTLEARSGVSSGADIRVRILVERG